MVAWPRTFQSKRLAWSSPEDRQWLPLTDSPHATHVLSFPICRSFPAVTCLDSKITARCLPQPTPEARNNLPRICYTRTPCWPLEEKEALPFRSWTIWFLATSWGNSGLNESFSCPWKSHRMQLAGTKSCRGSPRASAIPQKTSCSTLPVTNGLTAETLPPLNSPAKEDWTCLLYQSIHTERPLKTSRFYLFIFFTKKGRDGMYGWMVTRIQYPSIRLPWARNWAHSFRSGSEESKWLLAHRGPGDRAQRGGELKSPGHATEPFPWKCPNQDIRDGMVTERPQHPYWGQSDLV